jgi:hypothetical protein
MKQFKGCLTRSLPESQLVAAATMARSINPLNAVAMDTLGLTLPPQHIAVMSHKYWGADGADLTFGFMEPTQADFRNRISDHFNSWGKFCQVKASWTQTDPQIRITREGDGYWSYVGVDILSIPKNKPTMCLADFTMKTSEAEWKRVVRHEFGHTLGCPHEHMRVALVSRLDEGKTIAFFLRNQGWSPQTTRQQVLTPLSEASIRGSVGADDTSIMCYQLPGTITKDGKPIPGGLDFSEIDMSFMATIYPKKDVPVVPIIGNKLTVDFDKKRVTLKLPVGWQVEVAK